MASSTTLGAVNVIAETSDAGAELVYEDVPPEVVLRSLVKSSGGSVLRVKHDESFEGSFTVRSCPVLIRERRDAQADVSLHPR